MAIKDIIYIKEGCPFGSCEQGKFSLQVGEELKITLGSKNPNWDESFVAEVINITPRDGGWNYTLRFDDIVLNGAIMFEGCDIADITPYCCCEKNADNLAELIRTLCDKVKGCLDTNGDGKIDTLSIDASNVQNLTSFIQNTNLSSSQITDLTTVITNTNLTASQITDFCNAVVVCLDPNGDGIIDWLKIDASNVQNLSDAVTTVLSQTTLPQGLIDSIQNVVISVFSQDPAPQELIDAVQCILSASIQPIDGDTCEELTPLYLGKGADGKNFIRYANDTSSTRIGALSFDDDDGVVNTPPFGDVTPITYYGSNTPVPIGTSIFNADGTVSNPLSGDSATVRPMGNTVGVEIPTRAQLKGALDASGNLYDATKRARKIDFGLLPNLLSVESAEFEIKCDTNLTFEMSHLVKLASAGEAPQVGNFHISYTDVDNDGGQWWLLSNAAGVPVNFNTFTNYINRQEGEVGSWLFLAGNYKFAIHPTSDGAFATLGGDILSGTINLIIKKTIQ